MTNFFPNNIVFTTPQNVVPITDTQKRRIKYYYFDDMKFSDIARVEECDESSVRESIYAGIEKLKKILK